MKATQPQTRKKPETARRYRPSARTRQPMTLPVPIRSSAGGTCATQTVANPVGCRPPDRQRLPERPRSQPQDRQHHRAEARECPSRDRSPCPPPSAVGPQLHSLTCSIISPPSDILRAIFGGVDTTLPTPNPPRHDDRRGAPVTARSGADPPPPAEPAMDEENCWLASGNNPVTTCDRSRTPCITRDPRGAKGPG